MSNLESEGNHWQKPLVLEPLDGDHPHITETLAAAGWIMKSGLFIVQSPSYVFLNLTHSGARFWS